MKHDMITITIPIENDMINISIPIEIRDINIPTIIVTIGT